MDIITNSNKTRYQTTQVELLLPVDIMETAEDIHCSFIPDKIIVRNIYFENPSTNGDNIFLMQSSLFNVNSRHCLALHKDLKFQNTNLTFQNSQDINQTHFFRFKGANGSQDHDDVIHIILSLEFIKN